MSRSFIKTSALAAVSLALLYYNVAWAVLRCPHQENHPDHEIVFFQTGSYPDGVSFPFDLKIRRISTAPAQIITPSCWPDLQQSPNFCGSRVTFPLV
jgi:hypothetical protein